MSSKSTKACLVSIILLMSTSAFGVTGQIDTSVRYQKLEGFGAANVWSGSTLVSLGNYDPNIYDVLFGDLGLDILRLRNSYGYTASYNYINNCQHTITNARARTGRPLKILISSWSPQASLKSNGRTDQGVTLKKMKAEIICMPNMPSGGRTACNNTQVRAWLRTTLICKMNLITMQRGIPAASNLMRPELIPVIILPLMLFIRRYIRDWVQLCRKCLFATAQP
jgi:hypothetical protein